MGFFWFVPMKGWENKTASDPLTMDKGKPMALATRYYIGHDVERLML